MNFLGPYETTEELANECNRISSIVARSFRAIEAEDLSQELFIQVAKDYHAEVLDFNKWAFRVAQGVAARLHESVMNCKNVIQYDYTPGLVRKVLEHTFTYQNWESLPLPGSARSAPRGTRPVWDEEAKSDVYQSIPDPTDSRDVAADIQSALDLLTESDRVAIIKRYKFGIKPENGSSESKQLSRAVNRLTEKLNGYRGGKAEEMEVWEAGRRSMTNSQANYILKSTWNG